MDTLRYINKISYNSKKTQNTFDNSIYSNEFANLSLKNDHILQNQGNYCHDKGLKSYQLDLYDSLNDQIPKDTRASKNSVLTSQAFSKLQKDVQPIPFSTCSNEGNITYQSK